jgi:prevent-host-death family protein
MRTWQLQDAKAHFSELVKLSESEGPQNITLHGRSAAVLLSRKAFDQLSGINQNFLQFMCTSPLYGADDLIIERDRSPIRNVEF